MFFRLFFCFALLSTSLLSQAADRTAITKEIQSLESKSQEIEKNIPNMQANLESLLDALKRSMRDNDEQKEELAAQKALTEQDPSAANVRSLNLIENAVAMSNRSISTQERRIERQKTKLEAAKSELETTKQRIAKNINILATPDTEPESEPVVEAQPKPNPQSKPVINVEPPNLEVQKPAGPKNVSSESQKPNLQPRTSPVQATKPRLSTPPLQKQQIEEAAIYSSDELLQSRALITKINERIARSSGRPLYKFLVLKLGRNSATRLDFVGGDTYKGTVILPAGNVSLEINGKRFKRTIADKDGGLAHTVVVYVKAATRFDVDVFSNRLLEQLEVKIQE